jgi:hypothetical protein
VTARDDRQEIPSNAFQIAAPGPIQRRTGQWNMGLVSGRRKRINAALNAALSIRNRPESRSGNPGKVNRFCWI